MAQRGSQVSAEGDRERPHSDDQEPLCLAGMCQAARGGEAVERVCGGAALSQVPEQFGHGGKGVCV